MDLAVQGLDFLGDQVMSRFLAGEDQELANSGVDQAALLGPGLAGDFADGLRTSTELELLGGSSNPGSSEFPPAGIFNRSVSNTLGIFWG